MSRVRTGLVGAVVAAVASVWTISAIAHRWTGCLDRVEAGPRTALVLILPACFLLQLGTGALCAYLASRSGLLTRFRDPQVAAYAVTAVGILVLAAGLVAAAGAPAAGPGCHG
ncbi:hypothetical protein [Kitasatospora paranensis]|uniref:Uncharacterized protein n=1 Tax=Kitasatospora paranensis TaxID=258053 RepID=A0ABW2G6B0_9ACTN